MDSAATGTTGAMEARRALYYPYIHPRDPNWVKATILAFGQLQRIVPERYPLNDHPEVARLRDLVGSDGRPLVEEVSPRWGYIEDAQRRLLSILEGMTPEAATSRFGHEVTSTRFEDPDGFQIHENKLNGDLLAALGRMGLAWRSRRSASRSDRIDHDRWRGMHPELGAAVMSVTAIAAARQEGLDIVTDQDSLHHALSTLDEGEVLERLASRATAPTRAVSLTRQADDLAHLVMSVHIDVSKLSPEDVANLVQDGHDLRRFKESLATMVSDVPPDLAPEVRMRRLRERAQELVLEWDRHRRRWPARLKSALLPATRKRTEKWLDDTGDGIITRLQAATAGSGGLGIAVQGGSMTTAVLAAGVGLAFGVLWNVGRSVIAGSTGPDRYLAKVEAAGATVVLAPVPRRLADEG